MLVRKCDVCGPESRDDAKPCSVCGKDLCARHFWEHEHPTVIYTSKKEYED